jgi:hypothetical protein
VVEWRVRGFFAPLKNDKDHKNESLNEGKKLVAMELVVEGRAIQCSSM